MKTWRGLFSRVAAARAAIFGRKGSIGLIILAALLSASPAARAVDLDAGDLVAAPPGLNVGLLYLQHTKWSRLYSQGKVALDNAQLESDAGTLRFVHYMQAGSTILAPNIMLPFGRLRSDGNLSTLGDASGVGDVILNNGVWLVNKPAERNYFVLYQYLYLPTGEYDRNKALNLGENRWKADLQAGYAFGVGKNFSVELAGDVMFHGKNTDFGPAGATMKEKELYQFQGFLSYHVSPAMRLALGLSHTTGGETSVNGLDQNDKTKTTKMNFTVSTMLDARNGLLFLYGRDVSVENGLREDSRFRFRYVHIF